MWKNLTVLVIAALVSGVGGYAAATTRAPVVGEATVIAGGHCCPEDHPWRNGENHRCYDSRHDCEEAGHDAHCDYKPCEHH